MGGHRAIYADGWKAVTRHQPGVAYDDDRWELYDVTNDVSECNDLAAQRPDKLEELVALWWEEAEAHGVLPLDDRTVELFGARFRDRSPHRADRTYTYRPPMTHLPAQVAAGIGGRSWDLAATIDRPAGAGGVLYATGNENSGLSVFIDGDRLVFDYNCFGEHHVVESDVAVPVGPSVVGVEFRRADEGGDVTLVIDGSPCGSMHVPFVMRMISSVGASVGCDHGSPVSRRYHDENPFRGQLDRVDIALLSVRKADAADLAATDERATMARQ
jgi:arylsulfatase